MNDTKKIQHNYLIPESVSVSKGSSYIISMLHHYLEHYSLGEKKLFLHADNCVWQNKNNALMAYLNYRILHNLNEDIILSFMPVGHTKFSCDWAFGIFKRKFRVTLAATINDVAEIIEKSTPETKINRSVITSNERGEELFVDFKKWQQYFIDLEWKKIPHITSFSHFEFTKNNPGVVACKKTLNGEVTTFQIGLLSDNVFSILNPKYAEISLGLSKQRQAYLYDKIREYCPTEARDILCPKPADDLTEEEQEVITEEPQAHCSTSSPP